MKKNEPAQTLYNDMEKQRGEKKQGEKWQAEKTHQENIAMGRR